MHACRSTLEDPTANLKLGQSDASGNRVAPYVTVTVGDNTAESEISIEIPQSYSAADGIEATAGKNAVDFIVKLTPASQGMKSATLTVFSNDPDEPEVKVELVANVVVLPPCSYDVTPSILNFGLLTPGNFNELSFNITNLGTAAGDICLLSSLDLVSGSDAAYTLPDGKIEQLEIGPGQTHVVRVRSRPTGPAESSENNVRTVNGEVEFFMSSQVRPHAVVALQTAISRACLTIAPDDLDFGTVQKDCSSATRSFSIYNTCSTAVKLKGFRMPSPGGKPAGSPGCSNPTGCPEFHLVSTPTIPSGGLTINPSSAPVTFQSRYRPIDFGADFGAIAVDVEQGAQNVAYLVNLRGKGDELGLNTDTFTQDQKPKSDILLVIDNSGSMGDEQKALADNFGAFISYAVSAKVDYHMAVITSDNTSATGGGRFVSGPMHPEKVLGPETPSVQAKFIEKVKVGINGSATEMAFAPALNALTSPLITTENAGFLRDDASLAIVAITDELEQSKESVTFYYNAFLNIKGVNRASNFSFNAIAGFNPSPPTGCRPSLDDGRLTTMVQKTKGLMEDICTPSWSETLKELGKRVGGFKTTFFLTATPDLTGGKAIKVEVSDEQGTIEVPAKDDLGGDVWTYDSTNNSVVFKPLYVPEPGKTMTITYFVSCF